LFDDFSGRKYEKYLPPIDYYSKGLYMIDIGQNDIAGAFYSKTLDQVLASIPSILETFEAGLKVYQYFSLLFSPRAFIWINRSGLMQMRNLLWQRLYEEGGRNVWIHNTGPLGCLAQNIAKFGTDSTKLDEFGCVSSHNQAAKLFNLQLHAMSNKFQAQYPDANVTYVDIFSIKSNLIANYSRFGKHFTKPLIDLNHLENVGYNKILNVLGFEKPLMACCGVGGAPLNYDSRITCGQTKVLDGISVTAKACNDSSEYINWDGIHYTEAANEFVSSQILTGKYSDPPFSDQMPFFLTLKF